MVLTFHVKYKNQGQNPDDNDAMATHPDQLSGINAHIFIHCFFFFRHVIFLSISVNLFTFYVTRALFLPQIISSSSHALACSTAFLVKRRESHKMAKTKETQKKLSLVCCLVSLSRSLSRQKHTDREGGQHPSQ